MNWTVQKNSTCYQLTTKTVKSKIVNKTLQWFQNKRSHWRCSIRKGVAKNFAILTGKHLRQNLFLIKLQATPFQQKVFNRKLQHRCFPVTIAKILRTPVLKNTCERLFERFAIWAKNITIDRKWRTHFYQLDEKSLPLQDGLDHFVFLYSSNACLRRCLHYIIKDDSSEGL